MFKQKYRKSNCLAQPHVLDFSLVFSLVNDNVLRTLPVTQDSVIEDPQDRGSASQNP